MEEDEELVYLVDLKGFTFKLSDIVLVTPIYKYQNVPSSISTQFDIHLKWGMLLRVTQDIPLESGSDGTRKYGINLLHTDLSQRFLRSDIDTTDIKVNIINK